MLHCLKGKKKKPNAVKQNLSLVKQFLGQDISPQAIWELLPKSLKNLLCNHCKRVNNKFKKSYDLPLDLLQYRRENSAEY